MEKLPTQFKGRGEVSGVMFYQLFRHGDICLYKRVDPDKFTSYEVIKVRQQEEKIAHFKGREPLKYEAKERYPTSNEWQSTERGTQVLQTAINYFNQFVGEIVLTKEMLNEAGT